MSIISIIVPIYNGEKYLEECIDSILKQTFKDYELILVNDGSTDNSLKICKDYSKRDKRIKIIDKNNGGASEARNAGIDIAKGDYIGCVDSDDVIHPQMYEILYNKIIEYNADIAICNYIKIYNDKYKIKDINNDNIKNIKVYNKIEALYELYTDKEGAFIGPWQKIYKKKIFENIRYEVGRINEDKLISHRILYNSNKTIYIDLILYYYIQRKNSVTNSPFRKQNLDYIYALRDAMIFFYELKLDLKYKAEREYIYFLFKYYYRAKKELDNIEPSLKQVRNDFKEVLKYCLNSPHYSKKEKISWIIFAYTPYIYEILKNKIIKKEFKNAANKLDDYNKA